MTQSRLDDPQDESHGSLSWLVENWNQNESIAVEKILAEYFPRLRALSQRVLRGMPTAQTDADDVVQSAVMSFCKYMRKQTDDRHKDREDIWRLLCHFAVCKAKRHRRKQTKGDPTAKLVPMADLEHSADDFPNPAALNELTSNQFDDSLGEAIDALDSVQQQIVILLLEGLTQQQVGERLTISRKTVGRKLKLIHRVLKIQLIET